MLGPARSETSLDYKTSGVLRMRFGVKRVVQTVALVTVGGFLAIGGNCFSYLGESVLAVTDVCFIFDCTDAFGGTFEFCDPAIFVDCP